MSDLLSSGASWLASQRRAKLAHDVTYSRPSEGLEAVVPATVGRSEFEESAGYGGVSASFSTRDYLLTTADLADVFGEPAAGDRILDGAATWEVLSPGGQPPFGYSGQNRETVRVHVKEVAP